MKMNCVTTMLAEVLAHPAAGASWPLLALFHSRECVLTKAAVGVGGNDRRLGASAEGRFRSIAAPISVYRASARRTLHQNAFCVSGDRA